MKSTSKKSNYISPLGDRSKDDAYGLSDTNKKLLSTNKSDKLKPKKKRIGNGSNSSRKAKVKSKQANYQPMSGTIDLISRNERWNTQISQENSKNMELLNSRKSSHKRTNSIGTSDRSDNHSKNRFLVSKKYNPRMDPWKNMLSKENMKSCLTQSLKMGTSTSISKGPNHTNILGDAKTPTSATSTKINIKGSLLAKKWMGITKKNLDGMNSDPLKAKRRKKVKEFKTVKEPLLKGESNTDSRSPDTKFSAHHYSSGGSSKLKTRISPLMTHTISTSKRIESQIAHTDLYNQIIKSRKDK